MRMITINALQVPVPTVELSYVRSRAFGNKMLEPFLRARPFAQLPAAWMMVMVMVVVVVVVVVVVAVVVEAVSTA